jgi:hypothetical protein
MAIPKDWEYIRPNFFVFWKKIPVAWICNDYGQLQCLCPNCDYGKGYNKPIVNGRGKTKVEICKTCNTKFMAIVIR